MRVSAQAIKADGVLQRALGLASGDFKFGFQVRIFNWRMRKARQLLGLTQKGLGARVGTSINTIWHIEALRDFPNPGLAERIAAELRTSRQELFPDWLEFYLLDSSCREFVRTSAQVEAALRTGFSKTWPALIRSADDEEDEPDVQGELEERDAILTEMLRSLKPREQKVLVLRFGLDGGGERTLDLVGDAIGATRERVRQIESWALSKLRQHKKARALHEY